jgi:hypothetical protein
LVEPCAAPIDPSSAGRRLLTLDTVPSALAADEAYLYVAAGRAVFRKPVGGGCAETVYVSEGSVLRIMAWAGRIYLIERTTLRAAILSFAAAGFDDRRVVVEIEGRSFYGIDESLVHEGDLYFVQAGWSDPMLRIDLGGGGSTELAPDPRGLDVSSLTVMDGFLYWVHGGRVWTGDIDPWLPAGVARIARTGGAPEIVSDTGCVRIAGSRAGLWCITAAKLLADGSYGGSPGDVVKLAVTGEPSAPYLTGGARDLAVGTDLLFVATDAGAVAIPLEGEPPATPLLTAPGRAEHITTNGRTAFYAGRGEGSQSWLASFTP